MAYFDRDGLPLSRTEWEEHRTDRDYCIVKSYENEDIKVTILWLGFVNDHINIPKNHWKLYELKVENVMRRLNGHKYYVQDPIHTERYSTESVAIDHYANFLVNNTECVFLDVSGKGENRNLKYLGHVIEEDIVAAEHEGEMESEDCVSVDTCESNPDAGSW
tara:strand:- start:76667 stop:77152 length:486 start_codon:yes stop_codon:yes gene_type:complete